MLDRLLRAAYRRLEPGARNALRTWLALEERDCMPEPITHFDEARVLVIAPHSDDEVIGCGGIIARHVRNGATVHVAFMTDGRWGDGELFSPDISAEERKLRQTALIDLRKQEARAAAALLGTQQLHFLDLPDGALLPDKASITLLAGLLESIQPQLVYLPFVDLHEDHWQTNCVFAAAITSLGKAVAGMMRVRGYEVWTPLLANRVADISDLMPLKLEALAQFKSQLRDQDYTRIVEGLNTYRSNGVFAGRGHAEAFHEAPLAAYLRLVRAATLQHSPVPANAGMTENCK